MSETPDNRDDTGELREKYYRTLDQLEREEARWAQTETLLRNALLRISYAADTRNPVLNQQLHKLRQAIRDGRDSRLMGGLLDDIGESITALDDMRDAQSCVPVPFNALQELLAALRLPLSLRKRLRSLASRLTSGDPQHDVDDLLNQFSALLGEILEWLQQEEAGGRGLIGRWLRRRPGTGDMERAGEVREAFSRLLNELALPEELAHQAVHLQEELDQGVTAADLPYILETLADLIAAARESAQREHKEMAGFLKEVTEHLEELDSHIQSAAEASGDIGERGRELNDAVNDQVRDIETSMREATDLPSLKEAVTARLINIREHMAAYRENEEERQARMNRELERLQARMQSLEVVSGVLRERIEAERGQALRDPLTGVHNRLAYDERMEQEFARFQRQGHDVVLSVWDVDRFKGINDTYGHSAGDKVLRTIAQVLVRHVRATDFVARYGGEEFVILMPDTDLDGAHVVADKLRAAVEGFKFHYKNARVPITISGGLSQMRTDDTPDSLFRRADRALYRAKQQGRNRVLTGVDANT